MPETATGIMKQYSGLKLLVAASATWQTLTLSADSTEAEDYIHLYATVDKEHPLPRATIINHDWRRVKVSRNSFRSAGSLLLSFELVPPDSVVAEGFENQAVWTGNQVGAIMAEMEALEGLGEPVSGETHIVMHEYSTMEGPWFQQPGSRQIPDPRSGKFPQVVWCTIINVGFGG